MDASHNQPNNAQSAPWISFLVFTFLTIFALIQGQISVFYIIYLFWWEELLRIIVNGIFNKKYTAYGITTKLDDNHPRLQQSIGSAIFMLGIYLIFLIVFFGLIANWDNKNLLFINIEVLLFRNWFFNLNLIYILIHQINQRRQILGVMPIEGAFTPNMIVLHVSIIMGAILHFFVAKKFPSIFTPDNLWGAVIMILPFFLLRFFIQRNN